MNRRDHGGVNKKRTFPCYYCGAQLESYQAHKRHISRHHGKSEQGYDKTLIDELENRSR